ncbi:hypothetical protein EV1_005962 [Malus domestica]
MEINHSLVPTGFRFKPTDQELIGRFLRYFLVETPRLLPPPPHHTFMHKCNLFGNHSEPSEIWEAFGGGGGGALQLAAADQPALYFFSELTKKNPKGSNIMRKMGRSGGNWDGKAVPAWVEGTDGTSTCIGLKRTFSYKNVGSEDHGAWLLDEYSLFAAPRRRKSHTSYDFDYVLCRLRKTCPTSSSSEDDQVTDSTKNRINKRKCPTSPSSEDQVTTSNKRKKKQRANEGTESDDDQEAGSKQNMNLIDVVEEEEGQGNSCLTSNDPRLTITVAESNEIVDKAPTDEAVEEEVLSPTAFALKEFLLSEPEEVLMPTASEVAGDGRVEELYAELKEVLHPSMDDCWDRLQLQSLDGGNFWSSTFMDEHLNV